MVVITGQGIGVRVPRKEDDRLMRGRGLFVGDIKVLDLTNITFLCSALAHAEIVSISAPAEDAVKWY